MVLDWLGKGKTGGRVTVAALLARKQFAKAIELAEAEHKARPRDARTRLQLADALIAGGRGAAAVPLLREVADELASDGFAAKSIAILKRIQKIEPSKSREIDMRLATLIEQRSVHTVPIGVMPARNRTPGIVDEIGFEPTPRFLAAPAPETPAPAAANETPAPAPPPEEDVYVDLETILLEEELSQGTPVFPEFTKDELILLMQGLELITFEPGDIIVGQGEPGDSLFIITTGVIKAWVKDARGHYENVRQLSDGDFFGEISVLSGKPRTATVTAATRCEMLQLDRASLEEITRTHPHVRTVLQQFYEQRTGHPLEAEG